MGKSLLEERGDCEWDHKLYLRIVPIIVWMIGLGWDIFIILMHTYINELIN